MLQWTWMCIYLFELVFLFFSDKYQEMELLDNMVVLFLIFWGTSILFSTVVAPIYIPINGAWGFPLLHICANIVISCLFDNSHSNRCDISLWFLFAFPWWLMLLSTFSCTCWPSVGLLWKNVYSDVLPIFKVDCLVFCYWFAWVLCVFWILAHYHIYDLQIFSPI